METIYLIGTAIFLFVIWYYRYLTQHYDYWEKEGLPYMKGAIPGFGNVLPMFLLRRSFFQMLQDIHNSIRGRSMIGFYFGRNPALLVRDPELVKVVLSSEFGSFRANAIHLNLDVDTLMRRNPFFLEGDPWKSSRHQLTTAFSQKSLKYMFGSVDSVLGNWVEYVKSQVDEGNGVFETELKTISSRYSAEVIASAAFGVEGNSFKDKEGYSFVEMGKGIFAPTFYKGAQQIFVIFAPLFAKWFQASLIPKFVDRVFRKIVLDILRYRAETKETRPDFLQVLINLKDAESTDPYIGGLYDDETVCSHAASFFLAGYESIGVTMALTLHQLSMHPEIQQRLREEILTVSKKHNGITYDALHEMTYLEQVIYESMRLFPTGGIFSKICTDKCELKGYDGLNYQVKPGTHILISTHGLHRDPEFWPEPEKFDPERFSEANKDSHPRFAYLGFGGGPRTCPGIRVGTMVVKAGLATTLKNFSVELSPKTQMPLELSPRYWMPSPIGGMWTKIRRL